jgi:peptide-methionine (S)-S-oxide reductase
MKRFGLEAIWIFAVIWIGIVPMSALATENHSTSNPQLEVATFAGGCFWCMVSPFAKLPGVVSITSGYTGGHVKDPSYEQVSSGGTGHVEAVQMKYDPQKVSYEKLLDVFWHNVDPTAADHQFCDYGAPYRSEIFYHTEEQKHLAERSKAEIEKSKPFKDPIVTKITAASAFYEAEEYHQDFYKKNPIRYKYYRYHCGRDQRLEELWGKAQASH